MARHGFSSHGSKLKRRSTDQLGEDPNRETAKEWSPSGAPSPPQGTEALFSKEKASALSLAQETTIFIALFSASIADHLQARNTKVAVLLFLGGILNLSFLLFLFCLSLRFSAGRPSHRYFVAKVVF